MKVFLINITAFLALALLLSAQGEAGNSGASPWKPFLPEQAYQELTQRSIKAIEAAAKANDKTTASKIAVEAAILAGYTLSVKNPAADDVVKLRNAALAVPKQDPKTLEAFGSGLKFVGKSPPRPIDWKQILPDTTDLMEIFRGKAKRGEGIHADLQYHPKLKNQNGIESLLGALAAKKLSDDNTAKVAKELPNLAYRIAVVANVTYELAPAKDAKKWQNYSLQMRDASLALAEAAQQKKSAAILQAAQTLDNSCTGCHRDFRKK